MIYRSLRCARNLWFRRLPRFGCFGFRNSDFGLRRGLATLLFFYGFFLTKICAQQIDFSPVMDFEKNSESIHFQMVGPIIEHENRDSMEKFSAIRPLWSRYENFSKGFKNSEVLWPLGISRLAGKDLHQRFLFAIRDDEDVTSSESAYRNFLFPFFFRGKSSKGVPYMAIFPFWGSLKEFIGFDNVDFRLFPLYLSTEKGDLKGKQILFRYFQS